MVKKTLTTPRSAESAQVNRFKEAARELGCDEDEAAFDEKIKAIVKKKPDAERTARKK